MSLPTTPSFRLENRRAFVAGGSRGLGLAAAVALAEAGAELVVAARGTDELGAAVRAMAGAGLSATARPLDVTDLDAVRDVFEETGPFDILVNAAGTARHSPALDTDPADFDAVMALNARAAYFLAQAAARGMAGRGGGSIIQISSQLGLVGGPERAVYAASKHAVEGMTKAMAIEWGAMNVRVNTICPTFIRTALNAATFENPERRAWIEANIRLPRAGRIEDIMGAVLFLASDASALVTGSALVVDGGWTAA